MNYRLVLLVLGRILVLAAAAMAPPLLVSLLYGDGVHLSFLVTMAILLVLGIPMVALMKKREKTMRSREGFVAVALCWVAIALFGALPPFFSGAIPNYIDALFEMSAGFTTTGASILISVENLPESIVFWRAFSQWLGGMGVLILTLAILPAGDRGFNNLARAESTGLSSERLVPRIRQSATILYLIYLVLTVLQTLALLLGGMNLYEALIHAFATAGTGGFSSRDASVGAFNSGFIEYTIGLFMILFSVSFTLYYAAVTREFSRIRKNTEIKVFLTIIVISTALIAADLVRNGVYSNLSDTIRHSFFHTASLGSSTAFSVADYNQWPGLSKTVLLCLMAIGGCAGSTAGGLKVIRIITLYKSASREIKRIIHPRSISVVHINKEPVQDKALTGVLHFFVIYVIIVAAAVLLVSLDDMGLETTFSSVIAMISNVGPGFGLVGPASNYAGFSVLSKLVLSLTMFVGRLEIFPILMLFFPSTWRRA